MESNEKDIKTSAGKTPIKRGGATQYAKSEYGGFSGPPVDKDRFEEFKTRFYTLQGWDTETEFPARSTLEDMGLGYVADELEAKGKLGA